MFFEINEKTNKSPNLKENRNLKSLTHVTTHVSPFNVNDVAFTTTCYCRTY